MQLYFRVGGQKGVSDEKTLAKYHNFSHFLVKPMKITNHEKIKYERNCRGQCRIFLVIKEHGAELLGTGELSKSEFQGTPSFIFQEQRNIPPPSLGGPH